MNIYKVTINDAKPQVGIFEIIDGDIYYDSRNCNPYDAVGGAVEARELFHRDLCRHVASTYNISDEAKRIISLPDSKTPWMRFPRGRVWYSTNDDMYNVSTCKEAFNVAGFQNIIANLFSLPRNKINWYIDGDYELEADEGHYGY